MELCCHLVVRLGIAVVHSHQTPSCLVLNYLVKFSVKNECMQRLGDNQGLATINHTKRRWRNEDGDLLHTSHVKVLHGV